MYPEDDPEARIRDLERPLADQARTSERPTAGSGGYVNPLPPSVYQNGTYPAPGPARTGFRAWWLLLGVAGFAVICAAAVGAGGYLFSRGGLTPGTPTTRPSVYGGGGPIVDTPIAPDTPSGPTQGPTSVETLPPAGGSVSVSGVGSNRTIACSDSVVSISGVSNTVKISGHCRSVTVSGIENVVTVDAADVISASGFNNRVTFRSGSPRIESSGGSNVVEQG